MMQPNSNMSTQVLQLTGTPVQRGMLHGQILGPGIREFLGDELARINYLSEEKFDLDSLKPSIEQYAEFISTWLPNQWEEILGIHKGADISLEEAVLLQIRREVMGYSKIPTMGDCTTLGRAHSQGCILAQTIDLPCEMQDHLVVYAISGKDIAGGSSIVVSFTGLTGYLGLNAAGVAIGLNLVLGGDWCPGIPPYLAIREVINKAKTADEAVDIICGLPLASSRHFAIADQTKVVSVEAYEGDFRIVSGVELAHTNHFLNHEFAAKDELNIFARNSSVNRLEAAQHFLSSQPESLSKSELMTFFSESPVNVARDYNMQFEKTVAAVVMDPIAGEIILRRGNPALSENQKIVLPQSARRESVVCENTTTDLKTEVI